MGETALFVHLIAVASMRSVEDVHLCCWKIRFVICGVLPGFSERSRGKAKAVAEEVAHGIGVREAAEVGDAIKG